MEFVEYREILSSMQEQGLVEAADESGLVRLEMEPQPRLGTLHVRDASSTVPPYPDALEAVRPKEELAALVEAILERVHLSEVLIIPVSSWRDLVECIAFDLASDEEWQEIDAVAALHQNTRNALAVTRGETGLLIDMVRAVLSHGSSAKHDFVITSDVAPLLIEVFHDGAVSVTWDRSVVDHVAKLLREGKEVH